MKNQNSKFTNIDDIGLFLFEFSPLLGRNYGYVKYSGRNYGYVKYSEKVMKNQNSKLKNIDDIGLFLFAFSPLSMKELWLH